MSPESRMYASGGVRRKDKKLILAESSRLQFCEAFSTQFGEIVSTRHRRHPLAIERHASPIRKTIKKPFLQLIAILREKTIAFITPSVGDVTAFPSFRRNTNLRIRKSLQFLLGNLGKIKKKALVVSHQGFCKCFVFLS